MLLRRKGLTASDRVHHAEGLAIGRRLRHEVHADGGACTGLVVDHHRLAPGFLQLLADQAADRVRGSARRKGNDDLDRPLRKLLSRCWPGGADGHRRSHQASSNLSPAHRLSPRRLSLRFSSGSENRMMSAPSLLSVEGQFAPSVGHQSPRGQVLRQWVLDAAYSANQLRLSRHSAMSLSPQATRHLSEAASILGRRSRVLVEDRNEASVDHALPVEGHVLRELLHARVAPHLLVGGVAHSLDGYSSTKTRRFRSAQP